MDITKLNDLFLAYVPETVLSILIIVALLDKKIDFKNKNFYIKLIFSNIMILSVIVYSRSHLNNILYIAIFSTFIYTLTYKYIWKYNLRQSIIGGSISIFLIMMLEMIASPLTIVLMQNIKGPSLLANKFIHFMPVRISQIAILYLIIKKSISLKDSYLTSEWRSLSLDKKIICTALLSSILLSVIFGVNCIDMYVKTHAPSNYNYEELYNYIYSTQLTYQDFTNKISGIINEIEKTKFSVNYQIFFWGSIFLIVALFIFLVRTIKFEEYRKILKRSPGEFISAILENSKPDELNKYLAMFLKEVQIRRIEQIEKVCELLKKDCNKFTYHINENIFSAEIDYTEAMSYVEDIIKQISDTSMNFVVEKKARNVVLKLSIEDVNEIQCKALENYINKSDIKKELFRIGANVNFEVVANTATFIIRLPIQNRKEANADEDE